MLKVLTLVLLALNTPSAFAQVSPDFDMQGSMNGMLLTQVQRYLARMCPKVDFFQPKCDYFDAVKQLDKQFRNSVGADGVVKGETWAQIVRIRGVFDDTCYAPPYNRIIEPLIVALEAASGVTGNQSAERRLLALSTPEFARTWHTIAARFVVQSRDTAPPITCEQLDSHYTKEHVGMAYYPHRNQIIIASPLIDSYFAMPPDIRPKLLLGLMAHEFTHVAGGDEQMAYAIEYCVGFGVSVYVLDYLGDNKRLQCSDYFKSVMFSAYAGKIYRDLPKYYAVGKK